MIGIRMSVVGLMLAAAACAGRQDLGAAPPGASPGDWAAAWSAVTERRAPAAQVGEWVLENDGGGTIIAHHATRRVPPGALGEIDDSVLEARVYAAIMADGELGGADIGASADGGVVTLTGDARVSRVASRAVELVLSTPGVDEVRSRLTWR